MNFSLVHDPWIPAVDLEGNHTQVSLQSLFADAHKLGDVGGTPSQHLSLMRLLVAISQAAIDGPKNNQQWLTCRLDIQPKVAPYLQRFTDRFDLFGDRAFLQVPKLTNEQSVPVDALDYAFAVDSRTTWRDNAAEDGPRKRPAAWVALNLLAHQSFAAPGLIASGTFNGSTSARSATAGPAIATTPLHTLLVGATLLDTIWLNMVPFDRLAPMIPGCPVWERPPFDTASAEIHSRGFFGRLVPMSRGISLLKDDRDGNYVASMSRIQAVQFPGLPIGREPWATVIEYNRRDEAAEPGYVSFRPDQHPWRNLSSVLQLHTAQSTAASPPLQLPNILLLTGENRGVESVTIWTGGMAYDPSNAAKILGQGHWLFSVPIQLLGDAALAIYAEGVSLSNSIARSLRKAIRIYDETVATDGVKAYWHDCAVNHPRLISMAAALKPLDDWRRTVIGIAMKRHETLCRPTSTTQWERFFHGQAIIKKGAAK